MNFQSRFNQSRCKCKCTGSVPVDQDIPLVYFFQTSPRWFICPKTRGKLHDTSCTSYYAFPVAIKIHCVTETAWFQWRSYTFFPLTTQLIIAPYRERYLPLPYKFPPTSQTEVWKMISIKTHYPSATPNHFKRYITYFLL